METKKGDKGATPGQTSAEANGSNPGGEGNLDKKTEEENLDKRIADKEKQLEQLTQKTGNLTTNLRGLRDEQKEFKLFDDPKPAPAAKPAVDGGDNYEENDDEVIDRKVNERLMEKTKEDRIRMYNATAERFIRDNNEFDSENDVGGELIREFKVRATNTFLGETENQVQETMKFILAGIRGMNVTEEEKDIADIGDIESTPQEPDNIVEDWQTKKLNKFEKIAASHYPGGEKEYRKARAGIAKKK